MATMNALYTEEQAFRQKWLWALLLGMAVLGVVAVSMAPPPGRPVPTWAKPVIVVAMLALMALFAWIKLVVTVEPGLLRVHFFPFRRREVRLAEVRSWQVVTYQPIRDYGGWGIRYGGAERGWAYNVSGDRGVLVEYLDGRRLLVGSQRPEALAAALDLARVR
jgi:hypothetical protein